MRNLHKQTNLVHNRKPCITVVKCLLKLNNQLIINIKLNYINRNCEVRKA